MFEFYKNSVRLPPMSTSVLGYSVAMFAFPRVRGFVSASVPGAHPQQDGGCRAGGHPALFRG